MRTTKTLTIFILIPLLLAAQSQGDSCRSRPSSNAAQTNGKRGARADANREAKSSPSKNAARPGANQTAGNEMSNSSNTGTGNSSNKPEHPTTGASGRVASGVWGGQHIRMNVRADGASVEYDCAHGTIDETLELDNEGRFDAKGTHVREGPGPIRVGKLPRSRPARYTGRVGGDEMSLTLTLTDTSQEIGTYTLTRGSEGFIRKCR
ncbi:MAG: hypothetical protein LC802_12730 [Acidobacteria bacterium]|nr:hypothetical protein [Acidobacteriota bacterium]